MRTVTNEEIDRVIARLRKGWCQGCAAKTSDGEPTGEGDPVAAQWCAGGAMVVEGYVYTRLSNRFRAVHGTGVVAFNDAPGRTLDQVIAALEKCKTDQPIPAGA